MSDLDAVLAHIDADLDNALDRLFQTVRLKSISTDPAYAAETRKCAEWHAADLASIGFKAEVRDTPGHPIVLAKEHSATGHQGAVLRPLRRAARRPAGTVDR
jgi:acetylornithine deacetylase/succinyl-diaminopimelate desuccinylase-like protein